MVSREAVTSHDTRPIIQPAATALPKITTALKSVR